MRLRKREFVSLVLFYHRLTLHSCRLFKGIHGNDNSHVTIEDVTFTDFEVAAVSLNNVDTLRIEDCRVEKNRHDVPVVGLFSSARFIRYVLCFLGLVFGRFVTVLTITTFHRHPLI